MAKVEKVKNEDQKLKSLQKKLIKVLILKRKKLKKIF